jgi:chromosomal replication initiation ATPase DnaA
MQQQAYQSNQQPARTSIRSTVQGQTPEAVIQAVCEALKVNKDDLLGPERSGKLKVARRIAIGLILMADPMITLKQVGQIFSRNHTTIIYNRDQFYDQNGIDRELTNKVKMVTYLF